MTPFNKTAKRELGRRLADAWRARE